MSIGTCGREHNASSSAVIALGDFSEGELPPKQSCGLPHVSDVQDETLPCNCQGQDESQPRATGQAVASSARMRHDRYLPMPCRTSWSPRSLL
ncbi:hypothetical protein PR202_gb06175 [Eleusine coracana subsp. coracana]|uniref:Uncharacterized protein n=1 Tax=Eleusine coracana subsp. coracana TaxID=191504 RepID=A0AAV5E9N3_ELECO|nr:hypothetical protein PR202_gb06175 [Eleusine coracana subsp. coracana]